jgi:hypothetical protein
MPTTPDPTPSSGPVDQSAYLVRGDTVVVFMTEATVRGVVFNLRWRLDEILGTAPSTLVVEASQLRRLSSPTIAALLWANRHCSARGVQFVLRAKGTSASAMLCRAGLDRALLSDSDATLDHQLEQATARRKATR